MSLIFAGDIMGHGSQIEAAHHSANNTYNYENVFSEIKTTLSRPDFAIANLEVTLAGPPYSGYPQFSSPDKLAEACKKSGIDILVTANNHSCDRGGKGIKRTIEVLDKLDIPHNGTYKNDKDRQLRNLLILRKKNIRIGLLNYTYGTNGLKAPRPTSVNYIDTNQFLFRHGVNIIIGGHPHVIQRSEFNKDKNQLVAYSLGNFVSNQASTNTDGGMMLEILLEKIDGELKIKDAFYHLIWVHKPTRKGQKIFEVLPCSKFPLANIITNENYLLKMKSFIKNAREIMKDNINVPEVNHVFIDQ